jgi:hypothetical protein
MSARDEVKIGSTVYVFDINRRVYPPKPPGKSYSSSGPIWREHWVPQQIVGETSRSWITNHDRKIPKRGEAHGVAFDKADVDRAAWVHDNVHKIADKVTRCKDFDVLVRVAAAVGYIAP